MAPPQVRDLQALIAEQTAALQPQYQLIDQSVASNEQAGAAQEAGLSATKDKSFKNIEQTAQNKGMFFSGFSPAEQAEYTASTYLPALAQLQSTIASTRSNLLGKKAELGKGAFDAATNIRENDLQVLRAWEKMTAEQQFQATEAEKQRVFEAKQNQAQLAARSGGGGGGGSSGPSAAQSAAAALASVTGRDGYVSPGDYQKFKNQWVAAGAGSGASFDQQLGAFRNPKNKAYKLG